MLKSMGESPVQSAGEGDHGEGQGLVDFYSHGEGSAGDSSPFWTVVACSMGLGSPVGVRRLWSMSWSRGLVGLTARIGVWGSAAQFGVIWREFLPCKGELSC